MGQIRILHIVHTLNRGGMESRIMDIYRKIDRERFQYDFYIESGDSGIFDDEVKRLGGLIFYNEIHGKLNVPNFRSFKGFLLEHPEYKIIYAYNQWAGWYLKEAKKCGVQVRISNSRTSVQTLNIKNLIKNVVKLNVNKYSTYRFAVSTKAAIWLFGKKKVMAGNVRVWPNAIDAEKFAFSQKIRFRVRDELGLGDSYTVMHVGNVRQEKNHIFLLRIFYEITKAHRDAKLILVGGGDFEKLTPMIKELGIESEVTFLGVRTDVAELLQAADAFVFPSFYEGFPGAVLEAEASGLNCIISNSITNEVMIADNIVSLSLEESPAQWARAVDDLRPIDRDRAWETIVNAGYDINDLVLRTEQFYSELAGEFV